MSTPVETASLGARLAAWAASRVRIEIDAAQAGKFVPATVRVRTVSGTALEETAARLPGTPSNPMPDSELRAKALACLRAGARPLRGDVAARLAPEVLTGRVRS